MPRRPATAPTAPAAKPPSRPDRRGYRLRPQPRPRPGDWRGGTGRRPPASGRSGEPAREERKRVDRMPAGVPVPDPDLEVEVRTLGVAGVPHVADQLARLDVIAGRDERGLVEVHVGVVVAVAA